MSGYRSRGLGSIPGATKFSEKWARNGVHSTSWVQLRSYLEELVVAQVKKTEITAVGIHRDDYSTIPYAQILTLTLPTSGGYSVGIVRLLTQDTEFFFAIM
jgi:hypothetical protein